MTDALIMGGVLLAVVLTTQVGRRRHTTVLGVMPFFSCAAIGVLYFAGGLALSGPNLTAGLVGAVLGLLAGIGLVATTRVERDAASGHVYTRAGWPYLLIWLTVLIGRLVFIHQLEHDRGFAVQVGGFLARTRLTDDGVGLFFVLMALTMVLVRTAVVLHRSRRAPAAAVAGG